MTHADLACILPVSHCSEAFRTTLDSVLSLDACATEVFVVTNDYAAVAGCVAARMEDARVTVVELPSASTALDARAAGLECVHAPWCVFVDEGDALSSDAWALVAAAARKTGADLVLQAPANSRDIETLEAPAIARAVFAAPDPALSGAFMTRELAARAFGQLPAAPVARDSDLVALFSACTQATRAARVPGPLVSRAAAASTDIKLDAEAFSKLAASAQATSSAARLLSQTDGWAENHDAYEELVQAVLGKLLARYPYDVAKTDRGACFDTLAASWSAPELVSAVMHWRSDTLLPFMEAAQESRTLRADGPAKIERVAVLAPQRSLIDPDTLAGIEAAFRELGAIPKLFTDDKSAYPDVFNTHIELAGYEEGGSYLERGRGLSAALLEHGIDAVVAPLSADPAQAPDFLLARLTGVSVAVFSPERPLAAIPRATMPGLMRQVQAANVITVPARRNATFWSMASHARIVVESECGDGTEFVSRVLDALETPFSAPRETFRPDVAFGPLGPRPRKAPAAANAAAAGAGAAGTSDAERQLAEMKRQMELLQARLAGAENEAEELRRRLAESGGNAAPSDA